MTEIAMTRARFRTVATGALAALVAGSGATGTADHPTQAGPAYYGYRVVNAYPHDSRAYTQGLLYRDGFLFESTGLNGRSSLRKVQLETGGVVQERRRRYEVLRARV